MDADLFGAPIGPPATPAATPAAAPRGSGDFDDVQAVLRLAITEGYVLVGAWEGIYRLLGQNDIEGVARHEADLVRQLLDAGWLRVGAARTYHDGAGELRACPVLVPASSRRTLWYWAAMKGGLGRSGADHRAGPPTGGHRSSQARPPPFQGQGSPRRILVTGSREWTDTATIHAALARVWGDGTAVLISGACPRGADHIAETIWTRWGGRIERHRADWARHGRAAGFRRNAVMVNAGAAVCLAFIRASSPGSSHTAGLAEAAGIRTHRYDQP